LRLAGGLHVLRTNRALTDLVSLQPINTKYNRDADARRVSGSTCSRQFKSVELGSCAVDKILHRLPGRLGLYDLATAVVTTRSECG